MLPDKTSPNSEQPATAAIGRPRSRTAVARHLPVLAALALTLLCARPAALQAAEVVNGPLDPVTAARMVAEDQPVRAVADTPLTAGETSAADDPAAKRQAILDYVAGTMERDQAGFAASTGLSSSETLLILRQLSDDEAERFYEALPIIRHWTTIQERMAAGPEALGLAPLDQPRGSQTFSPEQVAELEEFRADLDEVFAVQQSWAPLVASTDPSYVARLDDGRRLIELATTEDLAALRDAVIWIPEWQRTLAPDLIGLLALGGSGPFGAPTPGGESGRTDAVGPAVTSEQCSDADRSRDPLPLIIAASVLKGTALIEGYIANFFTKDIKICFAVIFVTVCIDFPNPVFFILKLLEFASNRAVDGLNAAVLVAGVCTSIDHWLATIEHRNTFLTNSQDILASLITRHNTLIARAEQVDFSNREAWKLGLQLAIEENLLQPQPKPDGSDENRISLFQLTDSVCFNPDELLPTPVPPLPTPELITPAADQNPPPSLPDLPTPRAPVPVPDPREQCGIALVQRIVAEAIQLNKLAGNDVHNADSLFDAANEHFNAGRYKDAYLRYRQAYLAAVQPDAEPRRFVTGSADR